jgi:hypothetical protein
MHVVPLGVLPAAQEDTVPVLVHAMPVGQAVQFAWPPTEKVPAGHAVDVAVVVLWQ